MPKVQDAQLATRADREIEKLSKSPLWVFGWGLFLTSLTFISGVFIDLDEQNANIAKFNSLSHLYQLDERKIGFTTQTLARVMDAASGADRYFGEHIQSAKSIEDIPHNIVDEARRQIDEVRGGINAALSALASLHLNESKLDSHVQGFRTDLEGLDDIFAKKESICAKIARTRFREARTELDSLTIRDFKEERQLQAFLIRASAFDADTRVAKETAAADMQFHKAQLRSFRLKVYLLLPLSLIVGAFASIVIKRFRTVVVQ